MTFSKALSELLARKGIRADVVAPGPVGTPLVAMTTDPEKPTTFGGDTLLGRPAQPASRSRAARPYGC